VHAIGVKVEDDLDKLRDVDGTAAPVAQQLGVTVEKLLIDTAEIAGAELSADELEETSCAIEALTKAGGRKTRPMAGKVDVQPNIKILAQAPRNVITHPQIWSADFGCFTPRC
jgi:hypothetical protein